MIRIVLERVKNNHFYVFCFYVYMAKKQLDMHKVNMVNLLIEEVTINEIFRNLSGDEMVTCHIQISNGELYIRYGNLSKFSFD